MHEPGASQAAAVTRLVVVRHGETQWNVQGRMQGHLDSPLTAMGRRQADAVARALEHEPFDALYSSDLGRAYQTAEALAALTGHEIIPDPGLRERHLGIFQGLSRDEMCERYPREHERFVSRKADYVIPEGESLGGQTARVMDAFHRVAGAQPGRRVVVVTHGGPLGILLRHTVGMAPDAPRSYALLNASINRFDVVGGRWRLVSWGDVHHLAGIGTIDDP